MTSRAQGPLSRYKRAIPLPAGQVASPAAIRFPHTEAFVNQTGSGDTQSKVS